MIPSDSKAVSVPKGLSGSPCGHGDPRYTLSSNASVEHNNHMESSIKKSLPIKEPNKQPGSSKSHDYFCKARGMIDKA